MKRLFSGILYLIVMMTCLSAAHCADYYVWAGSGAGSHAGSSDDPFMHIYDATDIAQPGDTIHVAEGIYNEDVDLPDAVELRGSYNFNWSQRDIELYPSKIYAQPGSSSITAAGEFTVDGFVLTAGAVGLFAHDCGGSLIRNCLITELTGSPGQTGAAGSDGGSAYGVYAAGEAVTVYNCTIVDLLGGNGGSASEAGSPSGRGGDAYGIYMEVGHIIVTQCRIFTIQGGDGGHGINDRCHGGSGGSATGIFTTALTQFGYLPNISENTVGDITGGSGGNGGVEWDHAGDSAPGGHATGVKICEYSKAGTITSNTVTSITGGHGGWSPWAHFTPGQSGNGGNATAVHLENCSDFLVRDSIITSVEGGDGGQGGTAGDMPGSGDSTKGGDGGHARGVFDDGGSDNNHMNLLVTDIFGGNGNKGGAPMGVTTCSRGGNGGIAAGIDCNTGIQFVLQNTVMTIQGGHGGTGGKSYWHKSVSSSQLPVQPSKTNSSRITPTPTPTGTPGSGHICCGTGGDGGYAVGIRFPHCDFIERYRRNNVIEVTGGQPGECFSPITGEGVGMEKVDSCSMEIDFNNVFTCSTVLYRNMSPGPSSMSVDPLFTTGDLGDFYLSQINAGQGYNSPCIDSGDVDALAAYDPDEYTTRTDHEGDTGVVDLGFHYPFSLDPTPFPTETPTQTPTGPTATPTMTSTPTPPAPPTPPTSTPTSTPSPVTPTPVEYPLWVTLDMPSEHYIPGDPCHCTLNINNVTDFTWTGFPQFVILNVAGELLFAPDFSDFAYYNESLNPGKTQIDVIPEFIWPGGCGELSGVWFYAAITDPDILTIISNLETLEISWTEQ